MSQNVRQTGRGLVIDDDRILLMERWSRGRHYFSIPGGGVEPGETSEQAVVRELCEETGVKITVKRLIYEVRAGDKTHFIYLCAYVSGRPRLMPDSPEAEYQSDNDRWLPRWISLSQVPELPFEYWQMLKTPLTNDLKNGFSEQPKVISV